jgi:hypothetical protein
MRGERLLRNFFLEERDEKRKRLLGEDENESK